MFNHAHHFNVEKIEVSGQNADALKDLCQNIATGALLNSEERSDAPKCHPATRLAVQEEIFGWVTCEGAQPKILWLTGPAGSGKTTIMNTVGERLYKTQNLAATFFFSSFSGSLERSTKGRFITTLAYQLIQHDSLRGIRDHILSSIAKDPAILKMHLKEQMDVLILKPLRDCLTLRNPFPPQVLLVDGLDECGRRPPSASPQSELNTARLSSEKDQAEILEVLLDALNDPAFPFRVIVASRPHPAIQHFFSTLAEDQVAEIFLDDKYAPDDDIKLFLTSHFSRIQRRHSHLSPSWPGEDCIATLISNASGQMVYAATLIRFVETPAEAPEVRLAIALKGKPKADRSNPFEHLDFLYADVLRLSSKPELALKWLKAYYYLDIEDGYRTWSLNRLCETYRGEARDLFTNMSALVRISHQDHEDLARYTFYHKSFQEFLTNESRYGPFFITNEEEARKWLVVRFIQTFKKGDEQRRIVAASRKRFCGEILSLWYLLIMERESFTEFYDRSLIDCDEVWWISRVNLREKAGRAFTMLMFVVSHNRCRPLRPCKPSCRRWRGLIMRLWKHSSLNSNSVYISLPGKMSLLLDRFGLKRIPLRSTGFGVTVFHQKPSARQRHHESESASSVWFTVTPEEPWRPPRPIDTVTRGESSEWEPEAGRSSGRSSVATSYSGMFGDNSLTGRVSSSSSSSLRSASNPSV